MQTIIHLSDFHINSTMTEPEKNKNFQALLGKLKSLKDKGDICAEPIIVYTGDVIDSEEIRKAVDESLPAGEKAKFWDKMAGENYEIAEKYFRILTDEMNISSEKIIFCCGNHDVNTYYERDMSPCHTIDCPVHKDNKTIAEKLKYTEKRFTAYGNFLKKMGKPEAYVGNHLREINGFNFLVVNGNWLNKRDPFLCMDCTSLETVQIDLAKKSGSKGNIFVLHAPRGQYCENALYKYNNTGGVAKTEENLFAAYSCGDKHTGDAHGVDLMAGGKLADGEEMFCGIYQFQDENNSLIHKTLHYYENEWTVQDAGTYLNPILKLSEECIKGQALKYLFGNDKLEILCGEVEKFAEIKKRDNWKYLDNIFISSTKVRKDRTTKIEITDNFIDTITEKIFESDDTVKMRVKGPMSVGKSVSMTVLYLNLLHKYIEGESSYIPLYIDIDPLVKSSDRQNQEWMDNVVEKIRIKFNEILSVARVRNKKVLCILDGLSGRVFYTSEDGKSLEDKVENLCKEDNYVDNIEFVYGVDTFDDLQGLEETPQGEFRDSEYVVFFNRIMTYKLSPEKYNSFIESFVALQGRKDDADTVKNNIKRLDIFDIDTNMMLVLLNNLCTADDEKNYYQILSDYIRKKYPKIYQNIDKSAEAGYLLYYQKMSYYEIKEKTSISTEIFDFIRSKKLFADYLIARHFNNALRKLKIDTCINKLYDQRMSRLIRECVYEEKDGGEKVSSYCRKNFAGLTSAGRSTMAYLLGRAPGINKTKYTAEIKEYKEIIKYSINGAEEEKEIARIALRSADITEITLGKADKDGSINHVNKLLKEPEERKANRNLNLLYYGDMIWTRGCLKDDFFGRGIDFYKTYHKLAGGIARHLGSDKKEYPLLSLELFTLCDLLQLRIDNSEVETETDGRTINTFIYDQVYKDKSIEILDRMIELIEGYTEIFDTEEEAKARHRTFLIYLNQKKEQYEEIREDIEVGKPDTEKYKNRHVGLFEELCTLEKTKRMGWYFKDKRKNVDEEEYKKIGEDEETCETVLEHVYETYIMGLLYLPDKKDDSKEYDKQRILNTILIHDLGEAHTGDSVPFYEKYNEDKEEENQWCKGLYIQGIDGKMSNLLEYEELWNTWKNKPENENVRIARDLDKVQMLYKFLCLLEKDENMYTKDRIRDILKIRKELITDEGQYVFERVIKDNKELWELYNRYKGR